MMQKSIKITSSISCILSILFLLCGFNIINSISHAVATASLMYVLYDRYIWKLNPLCKTPKIYGVYLAKCVSNHSGEYNYTSEVTIRQTLSSISIIEDLGGGSHCCSIAAAFVKLTPEDGWVLYYTYSSSPHINGTDDMHEGTAKLYANSQGDLEVQYYTNRLTPTKGTMYLSKKTN